MHTCYFHPDTPAVGVMLIGLDEIPVCVDCIADTLTEDVYEIDFYDDVDHDQGDTAVLAELVARGDLDAKAS